MSRHARVGLAAALWMALAFVVWNVIFDRVLVVAGRVYAHDARTAMQEGRPLLRIDDYMRPAVADGARLATAAAVAIAAVGLSAIIFSTRPRKS